MEQDADGLAALAERFLDLWQDQMAGWAADPELAELTLRLWSRMMPPGLMPGFAPMAPQGNQGNAGGDASKQRDGTEPPQSTPPPRPEAVAAASGDVGDDVRQLLQRISTLEQRLATLETKPRRSRGSSRKRAGPG
jgi:hypothetical protein